MREIRVIKEDELDQLLTMNLNAYPRFRVNSADEFQKVVERLTVNMELDKRCGFYGMFEETELLGGLKLYDFEMNLLSGEIKAGGIGSVAVDLVHKKEGICKGMIEFALSHFKARKTPMVILYPFRPDFYKKMGFGFGTRMNRYRLSPLQLPAGKRDHIKYLERQQGEEVLRCYEKYVSNHSGMIHRNQRDFEKMFDQFENRFVGYVKDGVISGYIVFFFRNASEDNFILNNIEVKELVYDSPEVLAELLAFLHYQKDQINRVIINTQDDTFHFLFDDPRDDSANMIPSVYHQIATSGKGLMYRVVDVPTLFEQQHDRNFGGQTLTLDLRINDSFMPENAGDYVVNFKGRYVSTETSDCRVRLEADIADFSSMVVGAVSPSALHRLGKVAISDSGLLPSLDRLLEGPAPVCMTAF